jgi:hypothetical protein
MTEETLFHEALAKPSAERAAYLDAACAGQSGLRAAVAALLAAHEASGSLLDRPPVQLGETVDSRVSILVLLDVAHRLPRSAQTRARR